MSGENLSLTESCRIIVIGYIASKGSWAEYAACRTGKMNINIGVIPTLYNKFKM